MQMGFIGVSEAAYDKTARPTVICQEKVWTNEVKSNYEKAKQTHLVLKQILRTRNKWQLRMCSSIYAILPPCGK